MVGQYKPYSIYKESDIDWLGEIPKHWSTSKLRYNFSFSKGLSITKEHLKDSGIPCVNYGEVHSKYGFEVNPNKHPLKCVSEDYLYSSPNALLQNGDIVFADTSEDLEGSGNFTQLVSKDRVFAGYHTIIARPTDYENARFFAYMLDSKELRTQIQHSVKGVKVFSITQAILRGIDIWLPPNGEQREITDFLDRETAKIDTLIEKQRQLIKLLKEKRQAAISHTVTKGLNPDIPMKDSGVKWLGDIPEHWEFKKVGYACQIDNNLRTPIDRQTRMDLVGEYPYYGPTGVLNLINRFNVDGKYFLLGEDGDHFLKFKEKPMTILVTGKFNVNNHAHLIKGKGSCTTEWACLYFEHLDLAPWLIKQGVGRYKLRKETLVDIPILVPPQSEQEVILNYINQKKLTFERLISKAEQLVEMLKERRIALISAAVTGKIDVRNWKQKTEPEQATAS